MRKLTVILGCTLLAACGPAAPRAAEAPAPAAERLEAPPVHALIGHRAELGLGSAQIEALDSIGQWVFAQNEPLLARLRTLRGTPGERPRAQPPRSNTEVRDLYEQLRQNNRRAAEGVRALLTPEQQARTCELFQRGRGGGRGSPAQRPPPREPARADAARLPDGRAAVWPWCAPERPEPDARPDDTRRAPSPGSA